MPKLSQPRALMPHERSLLEFLLTATFPERDSLKSQVEQVEVTEECDCGCGTTSLRVVGAEPRNASPEQVVVEAYGTGVDVLLFARGGLLSSLEIVDHGDARPLPYPLPGQLTLWVPPRRPSAKA